MRIKRYIDRRLKKTVGHVMLTVPTAWGGQMLLSPHDMISRRIIEFGIWEPPLTKLVDRILCMGDTAIDIGANVGYYSCLFSKRVGPNGQVHGIEVVPQIYDAFVRNCELNRCDNVQAHNLAVTTSAGKVDVYMARSSHQGMSTIDQDTARRINAQVMGKIDALPLLDIVPLAQASKARLIKIDVEGAELSIIAPLLPLLDEEFSNTTWLIEFSLSQETINAISAALIRFAEAGYRLFQVENYYSIEDYDAYAHSPPQLRELDPNSLDADWSKLDLLITRLSDHELH